MDTPASQILGQAHAALTALHSLSRAPQADTNQSYAGVSAFWEGGRLWTYHVIKAKAARRTSVTGLGTLYRRKNRSVSLLHAHLVFCTKFRLKVFTPAVFAVLRASMEATARVLDVDIIAIEAERDYVHLKVAFPPKLALSDLDRRMKKASSRSIRAKRFPEVLRTLWGKYF